MKRLWKNSLIHRFFLSYLGGVLLIFVLFYFYSGTIFRNLYISSLSAKMQQEASILGRLIPAGIEGDTLDTICRGLAHDLGIRLTVIGVDGKVLGDSDEPSARMENHAKRPEVIQALAEGSGKGVRHSVTVGYDMLYQAVLQQRGGAKRIVRLSVPLSNINGAITSIQQAILFGLLAVSGLGVILAWFFSRKVGHRIQRLAQFSQKVAQASFPVESYIGAGGDELSVLERNLNQMGRRIQEKIKEIVAEKERLESILRCMIEGVLVVDTQGRLILLNENAQKMFDLPSARNLYGASFLEISRHPEMKRLIEEVLACDCSKECFGKEISLDEGRRFRVNAVSLRDGDERPLGYILVFHDVTELMRLETVRADLVANVSHELRTPLTAIRGYAETLLRNPPADPKDAEHFLAVIQSHSERLGRLIDGLLTLSDLESGKAQLAKEKVDAAQLVTQVLEIFRDKARKRNIAIAQKLEPNLPPILGDSDRLQQLLINLVDNAVKYTDKGTITVSARLVEGNRREATGDREQEPENLTIASRLTPHALQRWVELSVADTGCGIPEKYLPRLTERFYRVDKARSRELGGTGLGLAIVKHIAQAHRGLLKIESRIQRGTTVRVSLPAEHETRN
jgi:two-component system phosphate regulon sensor histidine kinase PhoR